MNYLLIRNKDGSIKNGSHTDLVRLLTYQREANPREFFDVTIAHGYITFEIETPSHAYNFSFPIALDKKLIWGTCSCVAHVLLIIQNFRGARLWRYKTNGAGSNSVLDELRKWIEMHSFSKWAHNSLKKEREVYFTVTRASENASLILREFNDIKYYHKAKWNDSQN